MIFQYLAMHLAIFWHCLSFPHTIKMCIEMWSLTVTSVQNNVIVACIGKESCEMGIIFT